MESFNHQARKDLLDRIVQNTIRPTEETQPPPPAYDTINDSMDNDMESVPELDNSLFEPHVVQVDASTSISGSGNVVHADAIATTGSRATAAITSILREHDQLQNRPPPPPSSTSSRSAAQAAASALSALRRPRPLRIGLNLSVRIAGGSNLVGCPPYQQHQLLRQMAQRQHAQQQQQHQQHQRPRSAPVSPTRVPPSAQSEFNAAWTAIDRFSAARASSSSSASAPAPTPAPQEARAVSDPVEAFNAGTLPTRGSPIAEGQRERPLPESASNPMKRKAEPESEREREDDERVAMQASKRSRVAQDGEEGLGEAEHD